MLLLSGNADEHGTTRFDATTVGKFIEKLHGKSVDRLEQSKSWWLSDATNTFASVALQLAELLDPLVPQSPEFTIPYGCLMIIFKVLYDVLRHGCFSLTEIVFGRKTREERKGCRCFRLSSTKATDPGLVRCIISDG